MGKCRRLFFIAVSSYICCVHTATAAEPQVIEMDNYQLSYTSQKNTDPAIDAESISTISLHKKGQKNPSYVETTTLIPGCESVPALQKLGDKYLLLCGHLGGRHYTYKLFRRGNSGHEVTTLDMFDSPTPLKLAADGSIHILVSRRDEFANEIQGPVYFPYVYQLKADSSTFGFVPQFGQQAARYKDFYQQQVINAKAVPDYLPAALAALVATEDKPFMCSEIQVLKKIMPAGKTSKIDYWLGRLPEIGYPKFDSGSCSST